MLVSHNTTLSNVNVIQAQLILLFTEVFSRYYVVYEKKSARVFFFFILQMTKICLWLLILNTESILAIVFSNRIMAADSNPSTLSGSVSGHMSLVLWELCSKGK